MMKQWKRLAALSSAIVMAAATLTYFPNDTLQNIRLEISASAETTTEPQVWNEDNLTWTLDADGTLTISGTGAMKDYADYLSDGNRSPVDNNSKIKKVVIEKGVTSIGNYAFSRCWGLKSITIPDGITSIGDHAFDSCINLRSITLPDSITSIGMWAFYNCWNVPSIIIPDGVTSIEDFTFNSCISLTSITIPNSVTNIKSSAFHNCADLTSITIPDSVTSIGYAAFSNCDSLQTISLGCGSALKKSDFGDQANLVSYTNQHLLTKTEAKAKTCTEDGNKEYWTCEHCGKYFLSDDTNPETAKAVEQSETIIPASHKLTKVKEEKAPTCTEDGNKEYWTCEHCGKYFLSDDTNPETAKAVELSETILPAIQHKNAELRNASEPTETSPGYSGGLYCPDCDKVVEKGYTYWNEDNLTWKLDADGSMTISGTGAMKDYGYSANQSPAYNNLKVKKVVIEKGVTNIGNWAFSECNSLTSITIPGNVESIGESAFYSCDNLTDVTLQDGVKSIGNSAFIWCNKLTNIVLPNSITSIEGFAFKDCTSLTSITIPDGVTSIGEAVFYNCTSLTSITIPDSVTSIGRYAFENCSSLKSITIPDSVTSIGKGAFKNCSSLKSITIPDSVTSIGAMAFDSCSNLKTISLSCKSSLKKSDFGEQADLVSYTNQHLLTKTEAKDATCTEDGNKEYWTCEHCGKYFLSDDANPATATAVELSETVIPASHKLTKVEAKDATCAENGNIEHWTCEHCKKYFLSDDTNPETAKAVELSEITIPPIKHSYDKNGFCKNDDTHYQPASYNEESEKYEISNAGQLYWFAEQVNSGNASLNAVLTTDIVVNETVLAADGSLGADPDTLRMWYPIGVGYAENIFFKGTFDGQGHTISGLYFSNDSNESDAICASLFGVSAGIIQNVGLEDSYFNYYYAKIDGQLIVNGVAAGICAKNNGQIVNCYNAGTILGYCASGICLENSDNGSIENCYNTGVIRGFGLVVGICNINAGSMKDCYNNNSDITVMTDSTIIDKNDKISYASGICNINVSSGRIENCYHVGQVSGADVNNNICNLNIGQIENSYYDCNICDKDAITQNESSAVVKNVESKTTKQFASGEVTYLLNGDQSVRAFYQNLAKEKYPTLNQKSKVVMQLEMIYDESFGEDATTNKIYHIAGDTIALETSPDKAYTYQYFVNGKQIEKPNYTLTGNTKMTVKRVPVEIELSEIDTIQLTCQKKMTMDLTKYLKNFVDLKPVQFQLATGSKLPDGLKLTEDGMLSGTPKKAATVKTTIVLTAENDSTKEMNLVFIVNAPVTTTTTTITTTTTTKATTTTKPSKTTTTKVTTTTKPNKTTTTKATTTTTTTISSYGDVNLDGMVDILDAVFLNKYLATLIQFSDAQMANADCCQDGVLNDQGTTALMQFIILLIDDLPVQPTEK